MAQAIALMTVLGKRVEVDSAELKAMLRDLPPGAKTFLTPVLVGKDWHEIRVSDASAALREEYNVKSRQAGHLATNRKLALGAGAALLAYLYFRK